MNRRGVALTAAAIMIAATAIASDALLLDPDEKRIVSEPTVAVDDRGAMVVAWASHVAEGAQPLSGIRIRRFDSDGSAAGEIFRIDVLPGDLARKPSADIAPDGSRFVVVWEGGTDGKRTKRRIWARVFDSAGRPLGVEFRVDQRRMTHEQWGLQREYYLDPKVSMAANGEFVVVWRSEGTTSCDRFNISARRFSPTGEALGDEFIVNTERKWSQLNPDVDHDGSGGFVVVWQSGRFIGTDWEESRIFARGFDAGGAARGGEVALSPDTLKAAALPSLVVAPNGAFTCAWKSGNGDDPLSRIGAGAYDPSGTLIGNLIDIEPETPGTGGPQVTIVRETELMVAWAGTVEDRFKGPAVVARTFNLDGAPTSGLFALSPATCWGVSSPAVASSLGVGGVAWVSDLDNRIAARRFPGDSPETEISLRRGGKSFSEMVSTARVILADADEDLEKRRHAAEFLSCMRGEARSAINDFRRCLEDEETGSLRGDCCVGLASVADTAEHALPSLLAVLRDDQDSGHTRAAAASSIGIFGAESISAVPMLISTLHESSDELQECTARALGLIGAYDAVDAMAAELKRERPRPIGPEVHRDLIFGLGELADDQRALESIRGYDRACSELRNYLGEDLNLSDLGDSTGLDRYIRHRVRGWRGFESWEIDVLVADARHCIDEGLVGECGDRPVPGTGRGMWSLDGMIRRFLAVRNLGPIGPCDCSKALAIGLSDLDPLPDWAGGLFSDLLDQNRSSQCLTDLLAIAENMGSNGQPMAKNIAALLRTEEPPKMEVLRALTATDPSCEACVVELKKLLTDPDAEVRQAAVGALIGGGPKAIWNCKAELTQMLVEDSEVLRHQAERALDLIEVEAAVCNGG